MMFVVPVWNRFWQTGVVHEVGQTRRGWWYIMFAVSECNYYTSNWRLL